MKTSKKIGLGLLTLGLAVGLAKHVATMIRKEQLLPMREKMAVLMTFQLHS